MYIPKYFTAKDISEIEAFVRKYPFALLVSIHGDIPIATHIPMILEIGGEGWKFSGHISKANSHHQLFAQNNHLLVFQEPHAYISPSLYEHTQNVPTWNYIAVHCYGKIEILPPQGHFACLEKMMAAFDRDYLQQWHELDNSYKENLSRGIVAFDFVVANIQAKEKLSQNKSFADRTNIVQKLSQSPDSTAQAVAHRMQELLQNPQDAS